MTPEHGARLFHRRIRPLSFLCKHAQPVSMLGSRAFDGTSLNRSCICSWCVPFLWPQCLRCLRRLTYQHSMSIGFIKNILSERYNACNGHEEA